MELEKIDIEGINNIYAISKVKKEFKEALDEPWKKSTSLAKISKEINRRFSGVRTRKRKGN